MKTLIKDAVVISMNLQGKIEQENVLIENDRIAYLGNAEPEANRVIDGRGKLLIPGLIQTHVHLPQTLFRGQADDMELLTWLKKRIWPLEGAHNQESIYYSALLGLGELLLGGTTSIVDMETVHHTESAIEAIRESGIRAITGKAMMDHGDDLPSALKESTEESLQQSVDLLEKWHQSENGRIQYAFTPRFVLSCSEELLKEVVVLSAHYGVKIHTHASENKGEIALVEKEKGMRNILYFEHLGLASPDLILAHCIWVNDEELAVLKK
ncbi:MAG: amidohydrolase family protein, partial [Clostridia bacterium]|nr:amidohydrolase family protein [Clostridia bacterium]